MNILRPLAAALIAALSIPALAQTPYLVKDLNLTGTPTVVSSDPFGFVFTGGKTFFAATSPDHGQELWVTDEAGTRIVKDIATGVASPGISRLVPLSDGVVLFAATSDVGRELWRSDGTAAGTTLVEDIHPGFTSSSPELWSSAGGRVYFTALDASSSYFRHVWVSDGTAAGTERLLESAMNDYVQPAMLTALGGTVYFSANRHLCKTDGTAAGTSVVKSNLYPTAAAVAGTTVLLIATTADLGRELWKTDGTEAGTVLLKDVASGTASGVYSGLAPFGSSVLFYGFDPSVGVEPWITDGTAEGTRMVADLSPGVGWGDYALPVVMGTHAYMIRGGTLWKTDGSAAGTTQVITLTTIKYLAAGDGLLYFVGEDTSHGSELWATAGTTASTALVADITPGPSPSVTLPLSFGGGKLYFPAFSPGKGSEPWVAAGTSATLLLNIAADPGPSSWPESLVEVGGDVYFTAHDDVQGRRDLWRSTGTPEGTTLLTPVSTTSTSMPAVLPFATVFSGRLYFIHPYDSLWQSDGTVAGTGRSATLAGLPANRWYSLQSLSSLLYFVGGSADYSVPNSLGRTDGTPAGTEFITSSVPADATALVQFAGKSYYLSTSYQGGLWETGGTAATSRQVRSFTSYSSRPSIVTANGVMYFVGWDYGTGGELWRSDGTFDGTRMVKDIVPGGADSIPAQMTAAGPYVFFVVNDANGSELWRSDGTSSGTLMVKDIAAGTASSNPSSLRALGSTLFFAANDGVNGEELWKSDGTEAGTVLVSDIAAGSVSSSPASMVAADGRIWFTANDGMSGRELWSTDGTAAGTTLVADIEVGSGSSFPEKAVRAGRRLFFAATRTSDGTELWALPLASTAVSAADANAAESGGSIVFTVTRSGDLSPASSVDFSTVDGSATAGSDYTSASGTLSFAPGEAVKSIALAIADDTEIEGTQAFRLVLTNAVGMAIESRDATGTIVDDDARADITLEFLPSATDYGVNDSSRYLKVTNAGPSSATGMRISFNSTPHYQGAFAPTVACSGVSLPFDCILGGALAAGASTTIQFQMTGNRGYADPTQLPGGTVTAAVSAVEPDPDPLDNSIAVMTSANGMLTVPSFLTAGQASTLMFTTGWPRTESFPVNFASTLSGVTIDPASITIPSGQMSGTTTIRPGEAVTGWTRISVQTPVASNPASMNVPVVFAGSQPQLDTAIMVGGWDGNIHTGYLQPVEVPVSVLARRSDGIRPTGTVSLIEPSGSVVQTRTLSSSAAASFSLNGSDPGTYAYRTRYEGDANFRPVTVPYPVVTIARLQVNVSVSIPAPACGASDIIITVKSVSSTTLAPPGTVSVIVSSYPPVTVSLSPTGIAGESRGVLRHTLNSGSQSVSASYPGSTYFGSGDAYTWVTVTGMCTPANLTATATAPNQVLVTWQGTGAQFQILRGETMSTFALIGVTSSASFVDNSVASGKTYLYKARSLDASGAPSPYSAIDLATTVTMTDNPVVRRSTVIKAAHILELRSAVNAVRAAAGLAAQTFEALAPGSPFRAVDITALRTALIQARDVLGMPLAAFTDSSLAGVPVKAIHVEELRNGVR